ncbi:MAG: hypothetical protein J0G32_03240 [Alphaproteobacteria bacterium]|nr:hypothetical protein [Alphaproteobacteria bacterium]OJV12085.1 MAG: hypothetical protein BGO27_05015 [Alphaproteobacteria bacterium 33-17]
MKHTEFALYLIEWGYIKPDYLNANNKTVIIMQFQQHLQNQLEKQIINSHLEEANRLFLYAYHNCDNKWFQTNLLKEVFSYSLRWSDLSLGFPMELYNTFGKDQFTCDDLTKFFFNAVLHKKFDAADYVKSLDPIHFKLLLTRYSLAGTLSFICNGAPRESLKYLTKFWDKATLKSDIMRLFEYIEPEVSYGSAYQYYYGFRKDTLEWFYNDVPEFYGNTLAKRGMAILATHKTHSKNHNDSYTLEFQFAIAFQKFYYIFKQSIQNMQSWMLDNAHYKMVYFVEKTEFYRKRYRIENCENIVSHFIRLEKLYEMDQFFEQYHGTLRLISEEFAELNEYKFYSVKNAARNPLFYDPDKEISDKLITQYNADSKKHVKGYRAQILDFATSEIQKGSFCNIL